MRRMWHMVRRSRGRCSIVHWLLVLGLCLQALGPLLASASPIDRLAGLQIAICTPTGMVIMDPSAGSEGSGEIQTSQTGHCLLCASQLFAPASTAGKIAPSSTRVQPAARSAEASCPARILGAWEWPPVRCPPSRFS
ncbi:DUF2946 family protein [Achromobacter denitrificans]